tara:strand:+ start:10906 stop:11082 length:177 start_codon:yes stop_codon:yes gene_type:complete
MREINDTVILNDLIEMFRINIQSDWAENDPRAEFQELIDYVERQRSMAKYFKDKEAHK